MTSKITVNTVKKEIKNAGLNPADFFIYNDGYTISVTANGVRRSFNEEVNMSNNTELRNEVLTRQANAEKVAQELVAMISHKFNCKTYVSGTRVAGLEIYRR